MEEKWSFVCRRTSNGGKSGTSLVNNTRKLVIEQTEWFFQKVCPSYVRTIHVDRRLSRPSRRAMTLRTRSTRPIRWPRCLLIVQEGDKVSSWSARSSPVAEKLLVYVLRIWSLSIFRIYRSEHSGEEDRYIYYWKSEFKAENAEIVGDKCESLPSMERELIFSFFFFFLRKKTTWSDLPSSSGELT